MIYSNIDPLRGESNYRRAKTLPPTPIIPGGLPYTNTIHQALLSLSEIFLLLLSGKICMSHASLSNNTQRGGKKRIYLKCKSCRRSNQTQRPLHRCGFQSKPPAIDHKTGFDGFSDSHLIIGNRNYLGVMIYRVHLERKKKQITSVGKNEGMMNGDGERITSAVHLLNGDRNSPAT